MPGNLSGPTLIVILFIVLLLFGAPKLPALAKSLGQSMKILKKEVSSDEKSKDSTEADSEPETTPAPANTAGVAVAHDAAQAQAELAEARAEAAAAKAEAEALRKQATEGTQAAGSHTE